MTTLALLSAKPQFLNQLSFPTARKRHEFTWKVHSPFCPHTPPSCLFPSPCYGDCLYAHNSLSWEHTYPLSRFTNRARVHVFPFWSKNSTSGEEANSEENPEAASGPESSSTSVSQEEATDGDKQEVVEEKGKVIDAQMLEDRGDRQSGPASPSVSPSDSSSAELPAAGPSAPSTSDSSSGSRYKNAKELLKGLSRSMEKLERGLSGREMDLQSSSAHLSSSSSSLSPLSRSSSLFNTYSVRDERFAELETKLADLQEKERVQKREYDRMRSESERLVEKLRTAEEVAKEEVERLKNKLLEQERETESALRRADERERALIEELGVADEGVMSRDELLLKLQNEALLSANALQQAAKAMSAARDRTLRIEEQLESMGDQLEREKGNTMKERERNARISGELAESKMQLQETSQRAKSLEDTIQKKEEGLKAMEARAKQLGIEIEEREKAIQTLAEENENLKNRIDNSQVDLQEQNKQSESVKNVILQLERALKQSEGRVSDLTQEMEDLKSLVRSKDVMLQEAVEEAKKSAKALAMEGEQKKRLAEAESRISQLTAHIGGLQDEVRSRDEILRDIKSTAEKNADAFRVAASIKQELNALKEQEATYFDELQKKEMKIKELERGNEFTRKARMLEISLKESEGKCAAYERELSQLKEGVKRRDNAIAEMRRELEESAEMIDAAKDTREALRNMQHLMELMQMEAKVKDERLAKLQKEFENAMILGSSQNQIRRSSFRRPSSSADFSSNSSGSLGGYNDGISSNTRPPNAPPNTPPTRSLNSNPSGRNGYYAGGNYGSQGATSESPSYPTHVIPSSAGSSRYEDDAVKPGSYIPNETPVRNQQNQALDSYFPNQNQVRNLAGGRETSSSPSDSTLGPSRAVSASGSDVDGAGSSLPFFKQMFPRKIPRSPNSSTSSSGPPPSQGENHKRK